jgi:predicted tellurium resistance membrane protein TerC
MLGVGMALVFLITFAVIATQLLKITGLVFAGGLLLLWVAYNMWTRAAPAPRRSSRRSRHGRRGRRPAATKTFLQAAIQITIADLSR